MARRYRLPLGQFAGTAAAPLALAYGIGRVGCFLAGDGTYGKPSDLPWAMAFPNGTMPTTVPVHPTALYEAVVAFALAGVLWGLRKRLAPVAIFGLYAVISGLARFLVEEIRINPDILLGTTQPQVWSLMLVVIGVGLLVSNRLRRPADDATCDAGRADTRPPLGGPPETQEPFRSVPVTRES